MSDDVRHLTRALALAGRGAATCRPNPPVGCVLVRGGRVVGEGWHAHAGGPHAEVAALARAGEDARGATAYVTLEPCDHTGRTGPCSVALLAAGVARVVVALHDPVPGHGGGAQRLRAAGVPVDTIPLAGFEHAVPRRWLAGVAHGRAWCTLKVAATTDGAMEAPSGRWITGPAARRRVHAQRAGHDGVLVGLGTVLADDPRLDVRDAPAPAGQPRPVVVDSHARTPADATVVGRGALVLAAEAADAGRVGALEAAGATVHRGPAGPDGRVDLVAAFAALPGLGVHAAYAEPGPTLGAALVRVGLVDELVVHRPLGATAWPAAWHAGRWQGRGAVVLDEDREDRFGPV